MDELKMLVGGEWVGAEDGGTFGATSPATGAAIATIARATRGDAQHALAMAADAWPAWAAVSAFERAAAMERIASAMTSRRAELARTLTLDQGKPLRAEAYDEVDEAIGYFHQAAADATGSRGCCRHRSTPASGSCYTAFPGRGGADNAVELPLHNAGRDPGPRPCHRERRGVGPRSHHIGVRRQAGGMHRRCGPSGQRGQHGDRTGSRGRRRGRRQPAHLRRRLHRIHRHRPPGSGAGRREGTAARDGR